MYSGTQGLGGDPPFDEEPEIIAVGHFSEDDGDDDDSDSFAFAADLEAQLADVLSSAGEADGSDTPVASLTDRRDASVHSPSTAPLRHRDLHSLSPHRSSSPPLPAVANDEPSPVGDPGAAGSEGLGVVVPVEPNLETAVMLRGASWGVFRITPRQAGPGRKYGSWQARCPFHRLSEKSECKKTFKIEGIG